MLGIGASEIISGRRPSIDRISTRRAKGVGVGVMTGVGVSAGVDVAVIVGVNEGVSVDTGVGVANPEMFGIWQAMMRRMERLVTSLCLNLIP